MLSLKEHLVIYKTLIYRETMRVLRIWPQTLLPSVITVTLYFLIFGRIVGNKIGRVDGFSYTYFITPGLIIMAVINNSYTNVVSSFFGARFSKSIEDLLISLAPNYLIVLGYISGGIVRGVLVGILVSIVAFLFGGFSIHHVYSFSLIIISFFCCSTLFALGGLLNGILSQKFDDTTIFSNFALMPLIYLGGIFYSLNLLPPIWQIVAKFNPLFYVIDFVRFAFLGKCVVNYYFAFFTTILFIIILYLLSWYLIFRGVRLKS